MNVDPSLILNVTWLGSALLLLAALLFLWMRGLHREYPWFFRYIAWMSLRAPFLYLLSDDRTVYFFSYWLAEGATVCLTLLVIHEIYHHVLRSSSFHITRSTFFALTVTMVVLAAASAFFIETSDSPVLLRAVLILTRTARIVQVGLLALLLIASMFYGFYWQSLPFGFALGYGLYATVELLATTFRSSLGASGDTIFALAKVLSYQLAVLLWIVFIYRHRPDHALHTLPAESPAEWLRTVERTAK